MPSPLKYLVALPLLALLPLLHGCDTCGFNCSDDNDDNEPASLTLSFSDAPLEDLKEVVIEVERIEFRRSEGDDLVVEMFDLSTSAGANSFQIDLLMFTGRNSFEVLTGLTVEADFYNEIFIGINTDENANTSYVLDDEDMQRVLRVNEDSGGLTLEGRQIDADNENITVEFGLARALKFNANDDSYTLDEEGIVLVDETLASSLGGTVDEDLFDAVDECSVVDGDATVGNRVYLYEGTDLDREALADVFTANADNSAGRIAPYAASTLRDESLGWQFTFGFLPSGNYTLAFSCNAEEDDARTIDDITVPLPDNQIIEVSLDTQQNIICRFNFEGEPSC